MSNDNLTTHESRWVDIQEEKIIGYGTDVWSKHDDEKIQKKQWILSKYRPLIKAGFSHETAYRLILEKMHQLDVEISDGYLRLCIRRWSGKRIRRMAQYKYTKYLDFDVVRKRFLQDLESGQYYLDNWRHQLYKDTFRSIKDDTFKKMLEVVIGPRA